MQDTDTHAPQMRQPRFQRLPRRLPSGFLPAVTLFIGSLLLAPAASATFSGGNGHTCWISQAGEAECWGNNDSGQLGDGTLISRAYPAPVIGLGVNPILAIGTGEAFTCALTIFGDMLCWGDNAQGQLGDGTRIPSLVPTPVAGLGGTVESFSPGRQHVCAVLTGGIAQCWGDNATGQIGDNSFFDRLLPANIAGLSGLVAAVATGYDHSCAVTTSADAFCWGNNDFGQLGDGTFIQRLQPTPVTGLSFSGTRIAFVQHIAAGEFHTCIGTPTGEALCWGDNTSGQAGNANLITPATTPDLVVGLAGTVQAIEAGQEFTCALLDSGGVDCWGNNLDGQLGNGSTVNSFLPSGVTGLTTGVASIGLGDLHACADTVSGLRYCWGDSFYGQLGNGSTTTTNIPIEVLESQPPPQAVPLSPIAQILLALSLALG
ncbi:MAG TPA: hypothetical protein EYQ54_20630, partial [Myxococcales bacterium]|nr:hypothetical protein [Myxococcales bacterium]